MPHFNRSFDLTIADIDLIEASLRDTGRTVSAAKMETAQEESVDLAAVAELDDRARQVHDLLGRLHNQKTFYRPTKGTYCGG